MDWKGQIFIELGLDRQSQASWSYNDGIAHQHSHTLHASPCPPDQRCVGLFLPASLLVICYLHLPYKDSAACHVSGHNYVPPPFRMYSIFPANALHALLISITSESRGEDICCTTFEKCCSLTLTATTRSKVADRSTYGQY